MSDVNYVVKMEFGSHVYGTNLPTSDTDIKALALPTAREILLQRVPRTINITTGNDQSRNTKDDIDFEAYYLHYFMKLLVEGQTVTLDMLFTPFEHINYIGSKYSVWQVLRDNKTKLLSKKMSSFAGYCQAQASKYGLKGSNINAYRTVIDYLTSIPRNDSLEKHFHSLNDLVVLSEQQVNLTKNGEPLIKIADIPHKVTGKNEKYLQVGPKTKVPLNAKVKLALQIYQDQFNKYGDRARLAEKNEGVDWKALLHSVRVCYEGIELLKTGNITFPRPEKGLLLKIRKGEIPYQQVADLIVDGLEELKIEKERSILPDKPDTSWMEDFVESVYLEIIKGEKYEFTNS